MGKSMWPAATSSKSNLERFLHSVTPRVPSKSLPKSYLPRLNSLWQPPSKDKDNIEYFTLGDLWHCYDEWSAYGVGTPLVLSSGDNVMQYYVPYLSAIQIYTTKSTVTVAASRNSREDSTDAAELESDSWSDDSGSDKLSRSLSNNSSRGWDAASEDSSLEHEGGSWPMKDKFGYLYSQYFEMSSPYWRVPLMDKITELSQSHPGLMTLKNVDLSPASWMAVAWYPIYHIPTRKNEKDLCTCFLTYHTLSSSFQDGVVGYDYNYIMGNGTCSSEAEKGTMAIKSKEEGNGEISHAPFGLATYKMQGDLWLQLDMDHERIVYLYSAADSWLKQLGVSHHDFNFFTFHSSM